MLISVTHTCPSACCYRSPLCSHTVATASNDGQCTAAACPAHCADERHPACPSFCSYCPRARLCSRHPDKRPPAGWGGCTAAAFLVDDAHPPHLPPPAAPDYPALEHPHARPPAKVGAGVPLQPALLGLRTRLSVIGPGLEGPNVTFINSGIRRQLSKYLHRITVEHGGMNCSTSALRRRGASTNTLVGVDGVKTLHMGVLLFTLADLTSVPPGDSLRVASLGPPASVSNCDFVATPMLKRAYQVKGGCEWHTTHRVTQFSRAVIWQCIGFQGCNAVQRLQFPPT